MQRPILRFGIPIAAEGSRRCPIARVKKGSSLALGASPKQCYMDHAIATHGAKMASKDFAVDTARFLFLVRGKDAAEMAELRCRELAHCGDGPGLENWKRVLSAVQQLIASGSDSGRLQN
jgi:hypothetical protein